MKRWRTLGGIAAAIGLAAVIIFLLANASSPGSPDVQAANAIAGLKDTAQKLEASLRGNEAPSKTAGQYLGYLEELEHNCHKLDQAYTAATNAAEASVAGNNNHIAVNEATFKRLDDAKALCKDLKPVIKDSVNIYTPVLPLLTASTSQKRWQTLPHFKNDRRGTDADNAKAAASQLESHVKAIEFPTSALSWTKQLDTAIKNSEDLAYLGSLRLYQDQLLAERVQYWTSYAGISTLRQNLKIQLTHYCESLLKEGLSPGYCKNLN